MSMALENPRLLSLAAGFTDNATLPQTEVAAAVQALCAGDPEPLQYGTNAGRPRLRQLLARRLEQQDGDGQTVPVEEVFITNGSQQALYLAMQVLCDPGDLVLVDQPSYFVFLEMLSGLGITALPIPVTPDGRIDPEALRDLMQHLRAENRIERLKAVYVVSVFSNPSGRSLDLAEKQALGRVLSEENVIRPVIEDAAYRELYYTTPPEAPSLRALREWQGFPILYLSTFTKPFATGLKVGYGMCNDRAWLSQMLHVKGHHDFGTANFNQAIAERVLGDGTFDRHLTTIRPEYERKMNALHDALVAGGLPSLGWHWQPPRGGLYLWLEAPPEFDTGLSSEFCRRCIDAGVLYVPGELCYPAGGPRNRVRLSFGVLGLDALAEAARRFAKVAGTF